MLSVSFKTDVGGRGLSVAGDKPPRNSRRLRNSRRRLRSYGRRLKGRLRTEVQEGHQSRGGGGGEAGGEVGFGAVEGAEAGDVDVGDSAAFAKRLARRGLDDGAEGVERLDDRLECAGDGIERGVVTGEVGGP